MDGWMDDLSFLTRRHAVKVASTASVGDCSLAIGEIIGHVARMNNATVIFLRSVEMANSVVEMNGDHKPILPLSTPSKKLP